MLLAAPRALVRSVCMNLESTRTEKEIINLNRIKNGLISMEEGSERKSERQTKFSGGAGEHDYTAILLYPKIKFWYEKFILFYQLPIQNID